MTFLNLEASMHGREYKMPTLHILWVEDACASHQCVP